MGAQQAKVEVKGSQRKESKESAASGEGSVDNAYIPKERRVE